MRVSSAPVTVTVCGVSQLAGVNVSVDTSGTLSLVSVLEMVKSYIVAGLRIQDDRECVRATGFGGRQCGRLI
jgi:hypothetical protein